ncbi:hypothetical protein H7X46_14400 [Pseudonocardia sp. C8]|uniref:hypothetical protein n=1 Tax=Pseudonocardia sp. C8 TaxID=2762759 RepID=UPI0016427E55|nr:hypothetical protein [Pseudonocardia sp. C8]MBC3192253.1 hypothetical protein [Pseudonocardia sp. C8]
MSSVADAPRLRDRRELVAQLDALHRWDGAGPTAEFYRGAAAALSWLADGRPAPLSGSSRTGPVTAPAVAAELADADDLIRAGRPRRRHFLIGVEHALMWAGHDTAVPPLPDAPEPPPPVSSWAGPGIPAPDTAGDQDPVGCVTRR